MQTDQHDDHAPAERTPEALFEAGADRAAYVQEMFGEITPRYDLVNRLMTLGRDQSWRRWAAEAIVRPGDDVVDAGTGTGDLAFACLDAGARRVVGLDFAAPMVVQARQKAVSRSDRDSVVFGVGDATRLPLPDESVDAWCAGFVVRNIPDLPEALHEALRVLRPGGRLAVLEVPKMERGVLRPFARIHFNQVVPRLGRVISGHRDAYTYLPVSVDHFYTPPEFTRLLRETGFEVMQVRMLMLGTVALHVARKPLAHTP